jgi:hypothetical protein
VEAAEERAKEYPSRMRPIEKEANTSQWTLVHPDSSIIDETGKGDDDEEEEGGECGSWL